MIYSVYFSPTNGTKKYVKAIAQGLGDTVTDINLTDFETRQKPVSFQKEDIVVLGLPVYGGRIPVTYDGLLDRLNGDKTKIVLAAVYGNRAYEDALLEMKNWAENHGFCPVAAAAFAAEHTYTSKLAGGRPDAADLEQAKEFGKQIKDKIQSGKITELSVPGNYPYRDFAPFPFAPNADDNCIACGKCASICPVQAIPKDNLKTADPVKCIDCFACVKVCPKHARSVTVKPFLGAVAMLEKNFASVRKEAEFFI